MPKIKYSFFLYSFVSIKLLMFNVMTKIRYLIVLEATHRHRKNKSHLFKLKNDNIPFF